MCLTNSGTFFGMCDCKKKGGKWWFCWLGYAVPRTNQKDGNGSSHFGGNLTNVDNDTCACSPPNQCKQCSCLQEQQKVVTSVYPSFQHLTVTNTLNHCKKGCVYFHPMGYYVLCTDILFFAVYWSLVKNK